MAQANRQHSDSMFRTLFHDKEKVLELYNAINHTDLDEGTKVELNTLEKVFYLTNRNDLSFVVDDKLVVVLEHQKSPNKNMPLRILIYIALLYNIMIPNKEMHKKKLLKIPTPEFYVLYCGKQHQPAEEILKLSDAFIEEVVGDFPLEVVVKVININHHVAHDILKRSTYLNEYSYFMHLVSQYESEGKPLKEAIDMAIEVSNQRGILSEFLQKHGSEVFSMLEWRLEDALEARWEEGIEEGIEKGIEKGRKESIIELACKFLNMGLSAEYIAEGTGLDLDVIRGLAT